MIFKSRWTLTFLSSFLLVASLSIWLLFAPMKLGGQVDYIIITGNSMEPRVHQNDLIVVRKSSEYHIGEAVAYRNSDMNRIVFHRIISGNTLHYTMQGDNNGWVDSYTPSVGEIVGKEWLFFPGAGKTVAWLKHPLNASLFAGIFGGSIMGFELFKKKKKKGSTQYPPSEDLKNQTSEIDNFPARATGATSGSPLEYKPFKKSLSINLQFEIGFLVLGIIALSSLIMFLISLAKPSIRITNPEYPYTQSIKYEYNAPAPKGVYDSQALATGDPIFTKLLCQVNLLATYQFSGLEFGNLTGTHRLEAVVVEPVSGWKRSFPLESEQAFSGDSFSSIVTVDFCQFKSAISKMEEQTGSSSYIYNISIEPNILQTGEIHGNQFLATFNSALPFQMDATRAFILRDTEDTNPLDQSTENIQAIQLSERNTIHLFSLNLDVVVTRVISALTLILSLVGLWLIFGQISKAYKKDKGLMVKLQYGAALINVENPPQFSPRISVNVTKIDDLAKIAEKQGTVILHCEINGQHSYYVEANGHMYTCSLTNDELNRE
jgi:signal peptidase I